MPVRAKVAHESPNGKVLSIGEFRGCLGMIPCPKEGSASAERCKSRPEVLLLGHDMHSDFKNMKKAGMDLEKQLLYFGCVDTHVITEDTGMPLPKGLSALMERYELAQCHRSRPNKQSAKWVFIGAHNAANDAIATLKVAIAEALDPRIGAWGGGDLKSKEDWSTKSFGVMNTNMILLAYDSEAATNMHYKPSVQNRTTEHGFAWLRLSDVVAVDPGAHGDGWHPFIQASHFVNREFRKYENSDWMVGNRDGFWPQYGMSKFFDVKDGAAPFDALFESLALGKPNANVCMTTNISERAEPEPVKLTPGDFPALPATRPIKSRNRIFNRSNRGSGRNRGRGSSRGGVAFGGHVTSSTFKLEAMAKTAPTPTMVAQGIKGAIGGDRKTVVDRLARLGGAGVARPTMSWANVARGKSTPLGNRRNAY